MKLRLFLVSLFASLLFVSCGSFLMKTTETKPVLKAPADKAVLVVYRSTSYGWGLVIDNFVDQKFIGQTKGKSYFVAQIDPGEHYIVSQAENQGSAKINFEAGKTYFLNQLVFPGVWNARTGFKAEDIKIFYEEQSNMDYLVSTGETADIPTLSDEDFKQIKEDYERESKEDPERFQDIVNIKGYEL